MKSPVPNLSCCLFAFLVMVLLGMRPCHGQAVYQQTKDVVYGTEHGIGLVMDIFTPTEAAPNGRGLVVVASGAWSSSRSKIRDLSLGGVFGVFCSRGYHVFAIRPGSISRFAAADMTAHIEEGIEWIKENASTYGVAPDHLGLFGASAGGHLASLVALTNLAEESEIDASVSAVGAFFPPTDFLNYGGQRLHPKGDGNGGQVSRHLEGLAFRDGVDGLSEDAIRDATKKVSPAHLARKGAPPFLLIHGDADPLVPLQQSERLLEALKEKDVEASLIVKPGGGHPWPTIRQEVVKMADWFDAKLGLVPSEE